VEAVIGAVEVEIGLLVVGALVVIVPSSWCTVTKSSAFTRVHILMRRSSTLSTFQAEAWH
jgi:hypothetical protein